ncbi:gamma-glutamyl-gamma-aminobutyrate hydrolase family protein [Candidatus Hepatobacter penaei]|uniref:gamma-glutamyl-gamma-aminobutyrate hydrolase family protein n=1 Tax=Candidatus Hepatobacter penaei TaxID=1274402 RepID=UPI0004F2847C|nr:gamma-glutamyl-gamma-aminobutyrate hydrolase family protein [Candidatus Hepatobacter penaei]
MTHPLVGITLDLQEKKSYSQFPWYALCSAYIKALTEAGGLPVALPHQSHLIGAYLEHVDGLIISGGDCDVSPKLYGQDDVHPSVQMKHTRTSFELAIVRSALILKMPLFGICGGEQVLNVALGGTLFQHIPDDIDHPLAHEQSAPPTESSHVVDVVSGTKLEAIVKTESFPVNSHHHQAVRDVGPGVVVNAKASDGVIEGIELSDHPFCLGVQWHPEYMVSDADKKIFQHFVRACTAYHQQKQHAGA